MTACSHWKATTAIILTLALLAEAGYVELFQDAYFEKKIMRVEDVAVDVCYNFNCDKDENTLDNKITSAKWHDLPESGDFFAVKGEALIWFYLDQHCKGDAKSWKIKMQSKDNMYFPENFRLDGMNDAVSSSKVINAGGNGGELNACPVWEKLVVTNATIG